MAPAARLALRAVIALAAYAAPGIARRIRARRARKGKGPLMPEAMRDFAKEYWEQGGPGPRQ